MYPSSKTKLRHSTHTQVLIGLMTAILCILGPTAFVLPFSPIPISMGTLGIYFAAILLGAKSGTLCVLLYLLLGFVGLPVFSGFMGGPAKVFGPTGGYLLGYLLMAPVCGHFFASSRKLFLRILGLVLGTTVCYCLGTIFLALQMSLSLQEALLLGVIPYLPGDFAKIVIAAACGTKLKARLSMARLL